MSSHEQSLPIDPARRRRRRRRWIFAAVLVVLIASALLGPPLINGERYRRRITTSMSQALGRPVHIDKVSFHLLPTPGITLSGLVVEENPAFGNEPVIRANSVEASLRLSSLWRHRFEVSEVKFDTDENGSGASLNIVRNAEGRWNLQDILVQAAHVNAAPTAQRKAGDAPRFPYIEAVGARVNLKLGDQKMPFSLTDADFALWLPSPQTWHIRLKAKPARTDTNVSDTGTITLDGTLGRAGTLADVPINLVANWAHVPTGVATEVLTGTDQDWRGTLEAGATLIGTVGNSKLAANAHLTDLRRSEFVPGQLLDISTHCTATMDLTIVTATNAQCNIPNGGPQPITVSSPAFDMQHPNDSTFNIAFTHVPLDWTMGWAKLFSHHIPDDIPVGGLEGQLQHTPDTQWSGTINASLDSLAPSSNVKPTIFRFDAGPTTQLTLDPTPVQWSPTTEMTVTGTVDPSQLTVHFAGNATPAQLRGFGNAFITPWGDGLAALDKSSAFNITCIRPFAGTQTCTAEKPQPVLKKHRSRR